MNYGFPVFMTGIIALMVSKETQRLETKQNEIIAKLQATKEELENALANVKQLSGLLPICSHCKQIRDDKGYWQQLDKYIGDHSMVEFSHSLCPQCVKELYPKMADKIIK